MQDKSKEALEVATLLEPYRAALALGAEIAAPAGSHFFRVRYYDQSDLSKLLDWDIGYYPTKLEAHIALANWIINEWELLGAEPWDQEEVLKNKEQILESEDPMGEYIKTYSISHIIDKYFASSDDSYEITKVHIEKPPVSIVTGVND